VDDPDIITDAIHIIMIETILRSCLVRKSDGMIEYYCFRNGKYENLSKDDLDKCVYLRNIIKSVPDEGEDPQICSYTLKNIIDLALSNYLN
jgi:hypothetical protein